MDIDLKTIEDLMKLMTFHKVDKLVFNGLELIKSKHELPKMEANKQASLQDMLNDEDLLFYSTKAPPIEDEEFNAFLKKK